MQRANLKVLFFDIFCLILNLQGCKNDLANVKTIDELNTIKNNYKYTKDININININIKLLQDLLNDNKKGNSIQFNPTIYVSMIEKKHICSGCKWLSSRKNHI